MKIKTEKEDGERGEGKKKRGRIFKLRQVTRKIRSKRRRFEDYEDLGPSYMVSGTRDNPSPELPWPR